MLISPYCEHPLRAPRTLLSETSLQRQKGFALVLVLSLLILVTVLVVSLFETVRTDAALATGYENSTSSRVLAESALNLVIGQIQAATQLPGTTWVSQPGLIRTYDTSGNPVKAFKLYSDDQMSVAGFFNPSSGEDLPPPGAGNDAPHVWADLNEPILTTTTDPSGNQVTSVVYPILDPRALGQVEGFDSPTEPLLGPDGQPLKYQDNSDAKAIPMPVKWLYLLQDGRLVVGTAISGTTVTIPGMTPSNPAIARLAFWTDDETCKVNINTAGHGAPWDTPMAATRPSGGSLSIASLDKRPSSWGDRWYEADFAHFQPSQHEYQRYPGHPATTSLSPILFRPIADFLGINPDTATFQEKSEIYEKLFQIAPRITGGDNSSKGGLQRGKATLEIGTDRLYASLDEMLFAEALQNNELRTENPLTNSPEGRRSVLEQTRFFLSTHSRSPEVTLSGKPRVAAWPLHVNDSKEYRSTFDRLIAFCGAIGPEDNSQDYFFTRKEPLSPSDDWNLRNKLNHLRNQEVYTFLKTLISRPIPGFQGTLASKWGADADQILTEIVDYIRCMNLQDVTVERPYALRSELSGTAAKDAERDSLRGCVVPLIPETGSVGAGTRGFGRVPTLSELAICMVRTNRSRQGTNGTAQDGKYTVHLIPELFIPLAGQSAVAANVAVEFTEINLKLEFVPTGSIKIPVFQLPKTVYAAHIPKSAAADGKKSDGSSLANGHQHAHSPLGGYLGGVLITQAAMQLKIPGIFPISEPFDIPGSAYTTANPPSNHTIRLKAGSSIKLTMKAPCGIGPYSYDGGGIIPYHGPPPTTIHQFEFTFPSDITLPIAQATIPDNSTDQPTLAVSRITGGVGSNPNTLFNIDLKDLVFSLVPNGGSKNIQADYRLLAATEPQDNLAAYFAVGQLPSGNTRTLHSFRYHTSKSPSGRRYGNLVESIPASVFNGGNGYPTDTNAIIFSPDLPTTINGVKNYLNQPGDWDNGPALQADGPYINKPDEGDSREKAGKIPYIGDSFSWEVFDPLDTTLFSPNRQFPSPVLFGSLPTGVKRTQPWQTLLFRPALAALPGGTNHPGVASAISPPDHLILDNFWMPIVEPYAISERFSTAGKINLNYEIAPFHFIRRDTGIRALLEPVLITALNPAGTFPRKYKDGGTNGVQGVSIRRKVDSKATLLFFEDRFKNGRPFISESEICEIPLAPTPVNNDYSFDTSSPSGLIASLNSFWSNHKLTGDNSLERPYAHIYPRVTTKSNTFQVHVRAQRLVVSKAGLVAGRFDDKTATVTGEFRGSFLIERFLDPNSDSLVKPDATGELTPVSDENDPAAFLGPYKFRVIQTRQLSL